MLVIDQGTTLRLITQNDHARLGREILTLWRDDGLPEHPRRAEILFAVGEHDNGWREADAAPLIDRSTGRPRDFRNYPEEERVAIWRRAVDRHAGAHPTATLLIALHTQKLHLDRRSRKLWQPLFSHLEELQGELLGRSRLDRETLELDYELLALADSLSLGLCGVRSHRTLLWRHYEAQLELGRVRVDPFPFAGPTTLEVPCRTLPKKRFRGEAELGAELAAARWGRTGVRIAPFGPVRP